MAILTNKPTSVSADSTTSLELNKADLQTKLEALSAGAYWEDQSTWKGVAFLFQNSSKQKVTVSFDASGNTANLNVGEFFIDGDIECKRIDVLGFANDHYTIYREDFTSASEFDIEITDGFSSGGGGGPLQVVKLYDNYKYISSISGDFSVSKFSSAFDPQTLNNGYYPSIKMGNGIAIFNTSALNKMTLSGLKVGNYTNSKFKVSIYEATLGNQPGFPEAKTPPNGASPVASVEINVENMPSILSDFDINFNNLSLNPLKKYYAFCSAEISEADAITLQDNLNFNYFYISTGTSAGYRAEERYDSINNQNHPDANLVEFCDDFNNDGILDTARSVTKNGSNFELVVLSNGMPPRVAVYVGI